MWMFDTVMNRWQQVQYDQEYEDRPREVCWQFITAVFSCCFVFWYHLIRFLILGSFFPSLPAVGTRGGFGWQGKTFIFVWRRKR
jgi:hypothetical protein